MKTENNNTNRFDIDNLVTKHKEEWNKIEEQNKNMHEQMNTVMKVQKEET